MQNIETKVVSSTPSPPVPRIRTPVTADKNNTTFLSSRPVSPVPPQRTSPQLHHPAPVSNSKQSIIPIGPVAPVQVPAPMNMDNVHQQYKTYIEDIWTIHSKVIWMLVFETVCVHLYKHLLISQHYKVDTDELKTMLQQQLQQHVQQYIPQLDATEVILQNYKTSCQSFDELYKHDNQTSFRYRAHHFLALQRIHIHQKTSQMKENVFEKYSQKLYLLLQQHLQKLPELPVAQDIQTSTSFTIAPHLWVEFVQRMTDGSSYMTFLNNLLTMNQPFHQQLSRYTQLLGQMKSSFQTITLQYQQTIQNIDNKRLPRYKELLGVLKKLESSLTPKELSVVRQHWNVTQLKLYIQTTLAHQHFAWLDFLLRRF